VPVKPLPAVDGLPLPVRQHGVRLAHRPEDRGDSGDAGIEAVARRDADVDGIKRLELACVGFDHGGG